jgi:ABC-type ATPase with predicted acetyltransferase domain
LLILAANYERLGMIAIKLTGCKQTPKWETLQQTIREMTKTEGQLTRIARMDGKCDYRATGIYKLTFLTMTECLAIDFICEP